MLEENHYNIKKNLEELHLEIPTVYIFRTFRDSVRW